MITPNNRIQEDNYANLTDYSVRSASGKPYFYCFVRFTDDSNCLLSNIFAPTRAEAMAIVLERFADCTEYITNISLYCSNG